MLREVGLSNQMRCCTTDLCQCTRSIRCRDNPRRGRLSCASSIVDAVIAFAMDARGESVVFGREQNQPRSEPAAKFASEPNKL